MDLNGLPSRSADVRMDYFRGRLAALDLDAYWVVHPPNVRYLSGFTGEDSTLLVTSDLSVLVTDPRFEEQAAAEACVDEIVIRRKGMAATVAQLCRQMGCGRIAFSAEQVRWADWHALSSSLPAAELKPCAEGPAERMRLRKSREEVAAIVEALRLSEEAFKRLLPQVQAGRSEKWLAARLDWEARTAGADAPAFPTICAVGERASLPHAVCTERCLGENEALLMDWGVRCEGYNSDLTRVVGTGTMPRHVTELAEVVIKAQQAAFSVLGPGVSCGDVDHAARKVVAKAGYGSRFGHSLGHGVGLEVHEGPRLGARDKQVLLPGMVVTIEPGIYLPGRAGVRIEDMAVITGGGYEILSSLTRGPGCGRV